VIHNSTFGSGTLEKAGFTVNDQHRIRRPAWTWIVSDLITVGIKS